MYNFIFFQLQLYSTYCMHTNSNILITFNIVQYYKKKCITVDKIKSKNKETYLFIITFLLFFYYCFYSLVDKS